MVVCSGKTDMDETDFSLELPSDPDFPYQLHHSQFCGALG
jgi:hypothetical protein